MRRIPYPAIGFVAVALIAVATVPRAAAAGGPAGLSPARVCYEQLDADNGSGIVSQNFEAALDEYDSRGADDFEIARTCRLTLIRVEGTYFNGTGTPSSVNVTVYRAQLRGPGHAQLRRRSASYTDCGNGCLEINVGGKLEAGSYWLGIQANQDFSPAGEWGWLTNNTVRGSGAMWKNPGDGFATGCTTYTDLLTCIPVDEGGDFAFSIQ